MATKKPEVETENRDAERENQIQKLSELFEKLTGWSEEKARQRGFAHYHYGDLLDLLDYLVEDFDDPETIEACERELDRRWLAYKTWKEKHVPEEDRDKIQKPPHERPPVYVLIMADPDFSWDRIFEYYTDESEC